MEKKNKFLSRNLIGYWDAAKTGWVCNIFYLYESQHFWPHANRVAEPVVPENVLTVISTLVGIDSQIKDALQVTDKFWWNSSF